MKTAGAERRWADTMAEGHFAKQKTGEQLSRHYWWPGWGKDVREYCRQCQDCQANKPKTYKLTPAASSISFPPFPWHTVSMDFITCLSQTRRRKDVILVVVDYFTKMGHFIPTTTTSTAVNNTSRSDSIVNFTSSYNIARSDNDNSWF